MANLAPRHGGLLHDELVRLGLTPAQVLDVSVNVNPYGPCSAVVEAIRAASLERYPDPHAAPAKHALSHWLDVPRDHLVIGSGAVDILWSLARCFVGPGRTALVVEPAFSELRCAVSVAGGSAAAHWTHPRDDFALDVGALDAALRRLRPALLYLCSPANPSGRKEPLGSILELAEQHASTLFVVDLSFDSLSTAPMRALPREPHNVLWLRSLTKDLALAGLRVGFAVGPTDVVTRIEANRPPWSINALAQAAIVAATSSDAQRFVQESRQRALRDREALDEGLRQLGLAPHPSQTIFSLVELPAARAATPLRHALLARHAVLVRDATSFGLPHHIRLCAQPAAERARLLSALAAELTR